MHKGADSFGSVLSTRKGKRINVVVRNAQSVIDAGKAAGLEFPEFRKVTPLLDTRVSYTVISKTLARHCKLFQTSAGSEVTTLGATYLCDQHAGAISFPGSDLKSFENLRSPS